MMVFAFLVAAFVMKIILAPHLGFVLKIVMEVHVLPRSLNQVSCAFMIIIGLGCIGQALLIVMENVYHMSIMIG